MKKKMKDVKVVPVNYRVCSINDVHAGKVNPHVPTAEDLDVSWPEVVEIEVAE